MNIREILKKHEFHYKKSLGQNFITDSNLLASIVNDSKTQKNDTVLEIGAGAGTLTRALSAKANRVVSFEKDKSLEPVLNEILKDCENTQIFFQDIKKVSDEALQGMLGDGFKVVANLPYYITTPLIMRFLESEILQPKSLTFMAQKEVAKRLTAEVGSPDYSAITLAVKLRGSAQITRFVDKKLFFPAPKVDSAVIHIEVQPNSLSKNPTVLKLIRTAFSMRRKTLLNNLINGISMSREDALKALKKAGLSEHVRGEELSLEQFVILSDIINKYL